VNLLDVVCISAQKQDNENSIQRVRCSSVEFEFRTSEGKIPTTLDAGETNNYSAIAAKGFITTLELMKHTLFVFYLRSPRVGDQVVYQRSVIKQPKIENSF
jgi:hypothetical protein